MKMHLFYTPWGRRLVGLWLLVTTSVCIGLLVNEFGPRPLALRYATKAQRMDLEVTKVTLSGSAASKPKPGELNAADQARYQGYLEAVKKRPADAYAEATAAWKWSDSEDLQRAVIDHAQGKVNSTDETEALELMVKALDDPHTQWDEVERLSRGNSLEKLIASRRTALLEGNAKVKAAHVAQAVALEFAVADHPQPVEWRAFRALAEKKGGIIVDARTGKLYREGHVPGAVNVSREEFANDYAKQKEALEVDKDRVVAVYCNGLDCEDSNMVAEALVKLGFRRVLIFKGGWTEWVFQHLPQEAAR